MIDIMKFVHRSSCPAWLATTKGDCVDANLALERLTGLDLARIKQADWRNFLVEEDRVSAMASWQTSLAAGTPYRARVRMRGFDGVPAAIELIALGPTVSDGTELWLFIGLHVHDVSEQLARKQAEFFLAEGQRLSHMGTWAFNAGGFDYWSTELFRIHGLDPSGKPPTVEEYLGLVHSEDREFVRQEIEKMFTTRRAFDFTKRIVRPNGKIRHVRCVGVPASYGETLQGFVGTGIDVTEQEQLTEDLRKSEMELRQMLDFAPQLIAVFGPNRERLYVNRNGLDYLGIGLDEWRQRSTGTVVHRDDLERLESYWARALSSGAADEIELRVRKGDGSYRWFLARYNPVRDDKGQILRWYVACTDIEDRKRAEERLEQENVALREEVDKASMFEDIVGSSPPLRAVLSRLSKVAPTDSAVFITGETGTGKELIARAIHRRSARSARAFVGVNCAMIPKELIASELFGHEKGAFTGALHRRVGRFELAQGGTLFLDEVGEIPPDTQVALLRVLQERRFERIGGTQSIQADVRVITATNRDLDSAMKAGAFRRDLFYRLNVFPIQVPTLRERRQDIPILVEYFIERFATKAGKSFSRINKKSLDLLQSYHWPGNIRELQNVIERSVILCETKEFSVDENWLASGPVPKQTENPSLEEHLLGQEKEMIEAALAETRGKVSGPSGAAAKLGMPATTLYSKIQHLRINKRRFRQ
jgi:PAS domain S-box-containing protein